MTDEIEQAEKKLILLLGLQEKPIEELFIQKELFLLSQSLKELNNLFEFRKHYQGPFSEVIHDSLDDPLYFEDSFLKRGNKFLLSEKGKSLFLDLSKEEAPEVLLALKLLRELYEKLNEDELLFLIYCCYPNYLEKSNKSKFLFSQEMKLKNIDGLLKKNLISEERAEELKWCKIEI